VTDTPEPPARAGQSPSLWILIGVPFLVEVGTVYFLMAVETPLTPWVDRLLGRRGGVIVIAAIGLLVVIGVMISLLTWLERRQHRASPPSP
jgi:hypothetical protein